MNSKATPTKRLAFLFSLLAVTLWAGSLAAQTQPGKAVVRSISGTATYATDGATFLPLKVGTVLPPGSTVKTAGASTVDLFLGNSAGVIRVIENSTLAVDKLNITDTGADSVVDVQLNLPAGTMLFNVNKLSAASKYEIKVPNGVAGIRGTKGRCSANSYIVLLDGTLIFVYVPPGGTPTPYTLVAPPPVYFSPLEGVKPAPADLIREVIGQFAGQIPDMPNFPIPPGNRPDKEPTDTPRDTPPVISPNKPN
jgi:hypothetical protein